jgi:hypothetical protein
VLVIFATRVWLDGRCEQSRMWRQWALVRQRSGSREHKPPARCAPGTGHDANTVGSGSMGRVAGRAAVGGDPGACHHGPLYNDSSVVPKYVPMAPTLVRAPFHRDGWVYEEKVDGWRILAYKHGRRVRLVSRNGIAHDGRPLPRPRGGCGTPHPDDPRAGRRHGPPGPALGG